MSADPHSGRNSNNAGSDTKKHYGTTMMEAFARASATPKATEQGTPTVRNLPVGPSSEGVIKNR